MVGSILNMYEFRNVWYPILSWAFFPTSLEVLLLMSRSSVDVCPRFGCEDKFPGDLRSLKLKLVWITELKQNWVWYGATNRHVEFLYTARQSFKNIVADAQLAWCWCISRVHDRRKSLPICVTNVTKKSHNKGETPRQTGLVYTPYFQFNI